MDKVFNVSSPRSGTQSMHDFLTSIGYKSHHWIGQTIDFDLDQFNNEKDIIDLISPLEESFNAFNDTPYTFLYDHFSKKYPNAKFILVERDPLAWYESCVSYKEKTKFKREFLTKFEKIYYGKYISIDVEKHPVLSKEEQLEYYNEHRKSVKDFFYGTDRLLTLSLSDDQIEKKICYFLGIKSSALFPNKDFLRAL